MAEDPASFEIRHQQSGMTTNWAEQTKMLKTILTLLGLLQSKRGAYLGKRST